MRASAGRLWAPLVAVAALWPAACTVKVPLPGVAPADDAGADDALPGVAQADGPSPSTRDAPAARDSVGGQVGEAGTDPTCAVATISTHATIPQMIIAFDHSSTMVDARITAIRTPLIAAIADLQKFV